MPLVVFSFSDVYHTPNRYLLQSLLFLESVKLSNGAMEEGGEEEEKEEEEEEEDLTTVATEVGLQWGEEPKN